MLRVTKLALTYDDISLVPRFSRIKHRSDISLVSGDLDLPIISSPMDTVTGPEMAKAMAANGALGVLHRYCSIEEQVEMAKKSGPKYAAAIGTTKDYLERAQALLEVGCDTFCVDVSHLDTRTSLHAMHMIRGVIGSENFMLAGNVCTGEGARTAFLGTANGVRVGIGGGSACTTRVRCGVGVPNITALMEVKEVLSDYSADVMIVADGGIRSPGDALKAFAAGADFVMLGGYLAGTAEAPGKIVNTPDGSLAKVFRGMASKEALSSRGGSRGSVEGDCMLKPYKGPVGPILQDFRQALQSGLAYLGCSSLEDMKRQRIEAVRISPAGLQEGRPHGK